MIFLPARWIAQNKQQQHEITETQRWRDFDMYSHISLTIFSVSRRNNTKKHTQKNLPKGYSSLILEDKCWGAQHQHIKCMNTFHLLCLLIPFFVLLSCSSSNWNQWENWCTRVIVQSSLILFYDYSWVNNSKKKTPIDSMMYSYTLYREFR